MRHHKKIEGSAEINQRNSINVGAVWGQIAGHKPLNERMAAINVPGISKKTLIKIENQIGASWETILADEMLAACNEEKKLALEHNDMILQLPLLSMGVGQSDPTSTVIMQNQGLP